MNIYLRCSSLFKKTAQLDLDDNVKRKLMSAVSKRLGDLTIQLTFSQEKELERIQAVSDQQILITEELPKALNSLMGSANEKEQNERTEIALEILKRSDKNLLQTTIWPIGNVLHLVADTGNWELIDQVINHLAIDCKTLLPEQRYLKQTPFHIAARRAMREQDEFIKDINFLLSQGLEGKDLEKCQTAVRNNKWRVVQIICKGNEKINLSRISILMENRIRALQKGNECLGKMIRLMGWKSASNLKLQDAEKWDCKDFHRVLEKNYYIATDPETNISTSLLQKDRISEAFQAIKEKNKRGY